MNALAGKVALITGASSGIGRATAVLFAQHGAALVLTGRRQKELDALLAELSALGARAAALAGDVADEAHARAAVRLAVENFGGLDIAVNNAGTLGEPQPTPDVPLEAWRRTLDTNLTGAFLGAKHQLPAMLRRGGGSVIFTSSFVGYRVGLPNMAAYAASKAGLIGLTQALAGEFGGRGIRVNALLPGGTDTPMGRAAADSAEARAWVEGLHALKRLARPEEIAQSALFLASDASSFTTGAALLADGGASISRS